MTFVIKRKATWKGGRVSTQVAEATNITLNVILRPRERPKNLRVSHERLLALLKVTLREADNPYWSP